VSAWTVAAPLFGVVLGGAIAGASPIVAEERRDKRQSTREKDGRDDQRREARTAHRWTAELEGVTSAQDALTAMVMACITVSEMTWLDDLGTSSSVLQITTRATLPISRVFDDSVRAKCETAANAVTRYFDAARNAAMTQELLNDAVVTADAALTALGEVRRRLYRDDDEGPVTNP
jgi:hypothetical protein